MAAKRNNQGFSLVELIISIAILAIISLPLIFYFTSALDSSEKSKRQQKAQLAAESVQEEIKTYSSYAQVASMAAIGASDWSELPGSSSKVKYLNKKMNVDGTTYNVKVTYDFNPYYMPSTSEIQYNSFEMPELSSLYSENNIIANENNEYETAVNGLVIQFYDSNPGVTATTVEAAMNGKTTNVNLTKISDTIVGVNIYSVYSCTIGSMTKLYEALPIVNTTIARDDLKNIYFLYHAASGNDTMNVNIEPTFLDLLANLNIYCVCQDDGMPADPSAYRLTINGNGTSCHYYSNNIMLEGAVNSKSDYVFKQSGNRVARITVSVFPQDETTFTDDHIIVSLDSTKGE